MMGFLQVKGPPSMTPPPSTGPGQGTVDKLATFFLSKFQESKQDSELTTLQCTTQLKFEALENMLEEQTRAMADLRTEIQTAMQSEVQSFRDKTASFFLEKFSAQMDTLGARRNEKCELALSRLEQRMEDEIRNLGDQLSDLSTKVAINNAALNASIDDTGRKISSGSEVSAENLRRCESEVRSKFSRLENLLESSRTEAAIERDRSTRMFQEANKRLQSKVDGLELTVMRQSEELTGQCEKIDRLETEIRNLSQIGIEHEKSQVTVMKMISTQNDEIAKLALHCKDDSLNPSPASAVSSHPVPSIPRSLRTQAAPAPSSPTAYTEYMKNSRPSDTPRAPRSMVSGHPATGPNYSPADKDELSAQRKRPRGTQKNPYQAPAVMQTDGEDSEPSPKRAQVGKGKLPKDGSLVNVTKDSRNPTKIVDRSKGYLLITDSIQSKRQNFGEQTARSLVRRTNLDLREANQKKETQVSECLSESKNSTAVTRPSPFKKIPDRFGEPPSKPEISPHSRYLSTRGKTTLAQSPRQEQSDREAKPASQAHPVQKPTSTRSDGEKQNHIGSSPPPGKIQRDKPHHQSFANRREATMAFMKHVQASARDYMISPPRSERQFIWSFLEAIPDAAWSEFMQKRLLEEYPTSVRPSLGIRAKHYINFNAGLTWRHVVETVRRLQKRPEVSA